MSGFYPFFKLVSHTVTPRSILKKILFLENFIHYILIIFIPFPQLPTHSTSCSISLPFLKKKSKIN